jgi:S1-C subfamily serine protease
VIQLRGASGLRTARLADTDTTPRFGDQVASIGNSYGQGYPDVHTGPITALHQLIPTPSAPGRRLGGLIEADNGIVPGMSGGPMVDRAGDVIGMNDACRVNTPGGSPTGYGYAIPIGTALHVPMVHDPGPGRVPPAHTGQAHPVERIVRRDPVTRSRWCRRRRCARSR